MPLADDTADALRAAAVLANSGLEPDTLLTVEDLTAFFAGQGYTGRHDRDAAELAAVRAVRPRVRSLLLAAHDDGVEAAVEQVNAVLAETGATPRLVRHDALGWHVHAVADDAPLQTRVLVETAMAVLDLVRDDELARLSVCDDADCDGVVVDVSRNRSRRYCSTACANRNAVAAYRARRRSPGRPGSS